MAPALDTNVPILTISALLLALVAKHYVADFVAQTEWMARGKEQLHGWVLPLSAHAGVQAFGTLAVAMLFQPKLWWIALVDFALHGLIDRGKALVTLRTCFSVGDPQFWWLMGFDQLLHQTTNVALAVLLVIA